MFLEVDNPLLDIDARVGIGRSVSVSQSVFTRIHNSIQYIAVYNIIYNIQYGIYKYVQQYTIYDSIDSYKRAISKCQSKWVHTSCHGFWPPSSPLLSLATSIPVQVDWTSNFKTAPLRLFWNKILLWIKVAPPPDILI